MPKALRNGMRMKTYGAPYEGGFMKWPLKFLTPVETALSVYEVMRQVIQANANMDGEAYEKWQQTHLKTVNAALRYQRIRDELEENDSVPTSN